MTLYSSTCKIHDRVWYAWLPQPSHIVPTTRGRLISCHPIRCVRQLQPVPHARSTGLARNLEGEGSNFMQMR